MTINIEIYTKKQPDVNDLARPLKLEKEQPIIEGYDFYKWFPERCNNSIWVVLENNGPKVYSCMYDKETLEDMTETARSGGFVVPKELTDKFAEDGYCVRADEKFLEILSKFPNLKQAFPHLNVEFNLAEFSRGIPLFNVGLEAKQFASKNTIKAMTGLASYFTNTFDGIMYEDQTNKFGLPNPEELHNIGMSSFLAIAKNIKNRGMNITLSEDL